MLAYSNLIKSYLQQNANVLGFPRFWHRYPTNCCLPFSLFMNSENAFVITVNRKTKGCLLAFLPNFTLHFVAGVYLIFFLKSHDDVIKWKHFPFYWPFVRGIHWRPVNSPHKGQWRGALMFSLISVWINGWVNSGEAGDLGRHRAHYDVNLISIYHLCKDILYLATSRNCNM